MKIYQIVVFELLLIIGICYTNASQMSSVKSFDIEAVNAAASSSVIYELVLPNGKSLSFDKKLLEQTDMMKPILQRDEQDPQNTERTISIKQYITNVKSITLDEVSLDDLHKLLTALANNPNNEMQTLQQLLFDKSWQHLVNWSHIAQYFGIESLYEYTIKAFSSEFSKNRSNKIFKVHFASLSEDSQKEIMSSTIGYNKTIQDFIKKHMAPTRTIANCGHAIAFSPDGKMLASGSSGNACGSPDNNLIKIWDPATGNILKTLQGHTAQISALSWSPDSQKLASGSYDKTIKVWDLTTGSILHNEQVGEIWRVGAVAWSPDGKLLAFGSDNGVIKICDTSSWTTLYVLQMPHNILMANSLAWSPDSKLLASSFGDDDDTSVKVWDVTAQTIKYDLQGHEYAVHAVAWSPNSKWLVSSSRDNTIKIWNTVTQGLEHTLRGHLNEVYSPAWSPDSQQLASGSTDGTIKLWDPIRGTLLYTLPGGITKSLTWSTDIQYLASDELLDGTLHIWNYVRVFYLTLDQLELLEKIIEEKKIDPKIANSELYESLPATWKQLFRKAQFEGVAASSSSNEEKKIAETVQAEQ